MGMCGIGGKYKSFYWIDKFLNHIYSYNQLGTQILFYDEITHLIVALMLKLLLRNSKEPYKFLINLIVSKCTLSELPENIRCFQGVEKGCIGNKWVKLIN